MVNINQEKLYATQWNESAKYFYETKRYQWMSEKLVEYDIVLEIGCGTGYSTLALVEAGHVSWEQAGCGNLYGICWKLGDAFI